jgi:hypothetical protein
VTHDLLKAVDCELLFENAWDAPINVAHPLLQAKTLCAPESEASAKTPTAKTEPVSKASSRSQSPCRSIILL